MVQKKRMQKHPFERVATPYQVYQWASPMLDHTVDAIRAEDSEYYDLKPISYRRMLTRTCPWFLALF